MPVPLEMSADLPAFRKELDIEVMDVSACKPCLATVVTDTTIDTAAQLNL